MRSTILKIAVGLLGGLALASAGLGIGPADPFEGISSTTEASDAAGDHGRPDDVPVKAAEDDESEIEDEGDGPSENADATAHAVHEAREMALALEDAPPCAVGMYVSTAARGGTVPDDVPDPMPCERGHGEEGVGDEGDEGDDVTTAGNGEAGPRGHGASNGHAKGGKPGRGGPPQG
ncbi:MAG TPA: hypothetical protein VM618_05295 [Acidimicrobiia bacterium]|nr:hypothetical protein [Acidimicrobiia bacterium]